MINELASRGRRGPQRHARSVPERRPLILRLLFCLFFFMISFQKCFHGVKTFRVENAFLSSLFGILLSDSNGAGNLAGEGPPTPRHFSAGSHGTRVFVQHLHTDGVHLMFKVTRWAVPGWQRGTSGSWASPALGRPLLAGVTSG